MIKYYMLILITLILNIYAQVAMKYAATSAIALDLKATHVGGLVGYLNLGLRMVLNPWVISAFVAGFLSVIFWIIAISKLPLSHAYPFLAATFIGVILASHFLFLEHITLTKIIGVAFISVGIITVAHS